PLYAGPVDGDARRNHRGSFSSLAGGLRQGASDKHLRLFGEDKAGPGSGELTKHPILSDLLPGAGSIPASHLEAVAGMDLLGKPRDVTDRGAIVRLDHQDLGDDLLGVARVILDRFVRQQLLVAVAAPYHEEAVAILDAVAPSFVDEDDGIRLDVHLRAERADHHALETHVVLARLDGLPSPRERTDPIPALARALRL